MSHQPRWLQQARLANFLLAASCHLQVEVTFQSSITVSARILQTKQEVHRTVIRAIEEIIFKLYTHLTTAHLKTVLDFLEKSCQTLTEVNDNTVARELANSHGFYPSVSVYSTPRRNIRTVREKRKGSYFVLHNNFVPPLFRD